MNGTHHERTLIKVLRESSRLFLNLCETIYLIRPLPSKESGKSEFASKSQVIGAMIKDILDRVVKFPILQSSLLDKGGFHETIHWSNRRNVFESGGG